MIIFTSYICQTFNDKTPLKVLITIFSTITFKSNPTIELSFTIKLNAYFQVVRICLTIEGILITEKSNYIKQISSGYHL